MYIVTYAYGYGWICVWEHINIYPTLNKGELLDPYPLLQNTYGGIKKEGAYFSPSINLIYLYTVVLLFIFDNLPNSVTLILCAL